MKKNNKKISLLIVLTLLIAAMFNTNIFAVYGEETTTVENPWSLNLDSSSEEPRGFDRLYTVTVSNDSSTEFMSDPSIWEDRTIEVNYNNKLNTNFQSIRVRVEYRGLSGPWKLVDTKLIALATSEIFTLSDNWTFRIIAYMDSNVTGTVEIRVKLSS